MRNLRLFGILAVLTVLFSLTNLASAAPPVPITNYCVTPPFVSQTINPNVLILVANSPTTGRRAYQNPLAGAGSAAYDNTKTYFGYFDSASWYNGASGGFTLAGTGARPNTNTFSGNFLNWITMRRMDLIFTVLLGGRAKSRNFGSTNFASPTEVFGTCGQGDYTSTSDVTTFDTGTGRGAVTRTMTAATACNYIDNSISIGGVNICSAAGVRFDLTVGNSCTPSKPSIFRVNRMTGTGSSDTVVGSKDYDVDLTYASGDPENSGAILDNMGLARWGIETLNSEAGGFVPNSVSIVGAPCGGQNFFTACGGGSPGIDCGAMEVNDTGSNPIAEAVWTGIGYYSQGKNPPASSDLGNGSGAITKGANGPDYGGQTGACPGSSCIRANSDPYDYSTDVAPPDQCISSPQGFPPCAKSFILLLTDGEPSGDVSLPSSVSSLSNTWADGIDSACTINGNVATGNTGCALDNVTLYGMSTGTGPRDIRQDLSGNQQVETFIVQANFDNTGPSTELQIAARNGAFDDKNGNGVPDLTSEWDLDGDGIPDNFFHASDGDDLRAQLDAAIRAILRRATSGTSASIIGAGKGSGANLLQAFFFPKKDFVTSGSGIVTLSWIGFLQNFWFEVDPLLRFTNIREDTDQESPDPILTQAGDDIDVFTFDTAKGKTLINRYVDHNPVDGIADETSPGSGILQFDTPAQVEINEVRSLWEAGVNLFTRDTDGSTRTIYTSVDSPITQGECGVAGSCIAFGPAPTNCSTIQPFLQTANNTCGAGQDSYNIIQYVRGQDGLTIGGVATRNRTVTLGVPPFAPTSNVTSTWKLGDVIDSTGKIQGGFALNDYDKRYHDATYSAYLNDTSVSAPSKTYSKGFSMVYSGANDGMLHAYYMGKLSTTGLAPGEITKLTDSESQGGKGIEKWAYVPKNALPYLRYLADPNYCHLYYVDLPPRVFDAAIGDVGLANYDTQPRAESSWRTIVVGGMGYGGGCGACSTGSTTDSCAGSALATAGFSSFFALDVTDPFHPKLLWEFNAPSMGYAFTSPAIVRIGDDTGGDKNGKWYVVIGSGPTGGINTPTHQFMGRSTQSAKLFVLDLKSGAPATGSLATSTIDLNAKIGSIGLDKAWVGALSDPFDLDVNQKDEAVYLSIAKCTAGASCDGTTNLWNKGDILRLYTHENPNPTTWEVSRLLNADIGPVTAKVSGLTANQRTDLWLYFGTGRFYNKIASKSDDSATTPATDNTHQRRIYGVRDPCFSAANHALDESCSSPVDISDTTNFKNVTTTASATPPTKGWYINLCTQADTANCTGTATPASTDLEERSISDTQTSPLGVVFFTTFAPSNDPCTFGGKTFIYALKFDTGGSGAGFLFGSAIVQTSTGAIQEITLTNAFTERASSNEGTTGRRTGFFLGQAPVESPLIVLTPPPIQKILRLKEK